MSAKSKIAKVPPKAKVLSKATSAPKAKVPPKAKVLAKTKSTPKAKVKEHETETEITKKKRVKPTVYDHIAHYDQLLDLLKGEIDKKSRAKENGVRSLQKARKIVELMRKEVPHITRSKEVRAAFSTRKNTPSGFTMKYYVSEELANFLQIDVNVDTISRVDVTRAISVYVHLKPDEDREEILQWAYLNPAGKRNLQNPQNKKTIIPDKALMTLFRLKNKEPIGYAIQGLLKHHFLEAVKPEENAGEEVGDEPEDEGEVDAEDVEDEEGEVDPEYE